MSKTVAPFLRIFGRWITRRSDITAGERSGIRCCRVSKRAEPLYGGKMRHRDWQNMMVLILVEFLFLEIGSRFADLADVEVRKVRKPGTILSNHFRGSASDRGAHFLENFLDEE